MPLTDTALNAMADHLASLATEVSLHSADPGATGANAETSAARQTASWAAASGGDLALSAAEQFTGGASNGAVTWVGLWNTGGTVFYGRFQIPNNGTNDLSFNAAGEYVLNSLTISGAST